MSVDLETHKFEKRGQSMVLVDTNHYACILDPNSSKKYYIQRGKYYAGLNEELKDPPQWLTDRVKNMNPKVLEQCGFGKGGAKAKTKGMGDAERLKQLFRDGLLSETEYHRLTGNGKAEPVLEEEVKNETQEAKEQETVLSELSRFELMRLCKEKEIPVSISDKKDDLLKKLEV